MIQCAFLPTINTLYCRPMHWDWICFNLYFTFYGNVIFIDNKSNRIFLMSYSVRHLRSVGCFANLEVSYGYYQPFAVKGAFRSQKLVQSASIKSMLRFKGYFLLIIKKVVYFLVRQGQNILLHVAYYCNWFV